MLKPWSLFDVLIEKYEWDPKIAQVDILSIIYVSEVMIAAMNPSKMVYFQQQKNNFGKRVSLFNTKKPSCIFNY